MSYDSWSRVQAEQIDRFKIIMKLINAQVFTIYVCSKCGYSNKSWISIARHIYDVHSIGEGNDSED